MNKKIIKEISTTNKIGNQIGGATAWSNISWKQMVEYWRKKIYNTLNYKVLE